MDYEDDFRVRMKAGAFAIFCGFITAAVLAGGFYLFNALNSDNLMVVVLPITVFVMFFFAVYCSFRSNESYCFRMTSKYDCLATFRSSGKEILYLYSGIALGFSLCISAGQALSVVEHLMGWRTIAGPALIFGYTFVASGFVLAGGIVAGYLARKSDFDIYLDRELENK